MMFCRNECIGAGSGKGEGARDSRIDARHAPRTRIYASRRLDTASKLLRGKLIPTYYHTGLLRARYLNVITPTS